MTKFYYHTPGGRDLISFYDSSPHETDWAYCFRHLDGEWRFRRRGSFGDDIWAGGSEELSLRLYEANKNREDFEVEG